MRQRQYFPWLIILAYVTLIYATLGSVRCFSEALRARGVLGNTTMALLLLLLAGTIGVGWWRLSSLRAKMLLALLLGATLAASMLMLAFPEERLHVVEYGLLGWLLGRALERSGKWPAGIWLGILLAWLIGTGDEMIQWLLPNRVFDPRDLVVNGLAGMVGLAVYGIFAREGKKPA